jgi:exosome complex RNA-binding protein Rrp4
MEVDQIANSNEAYPGKLLLPNTSVVAGEGTYVYLGKIYANIRGTVTLLPRRSYYNPYDTEKLIVKSHSTAAEETKSKQEETLSR